MMEVLDIGGAEEYTALQMYVMTLNCIFLNGSKINIVYILT